ncbi:type IV pilin protein [Variovorax sp. OV329]|uniref:type IV pilin protein n=1 Tax=Variovorax sp. OV329 TaxID=1882825 RepID=UPI0008DF7115|nr:type IV pilin protein [Variovorax sp. OV329]SFN15942.1 type IV pilus assembly protein PilE [Variovorax sp. OV329]
MNASRPLSRGFSLVEILIVLAMVALLAAVALPMYDGHIRRARRAEARTALLQLAHRLEREATATGAYPPGELPASYADAAGGHYRISRVAPASDLDGALRFSLQAIPLGPQTRDDCGTLPLNSTGERGLIDNRAPVALCWHR